MAGKTFQGFVPIVVAAALLAASGCAARRTTLASRFVTPGEPTATYDDPAVPAPKPLPEQVRKVRALQSRAAPKNSLLPTIESTDPALSAALLLVALQDTAEHHRGAAVAYRNAGIPDYAYKHFQRATILDPCDAVAYDGMARIWRDWGMPDMALAEVYHAIHCNRASPEIYNTLGTILEALGQPAEAHHAYEHAVALDGTAAFALNNLCYLEMESGNGDAAAGLCERALAVAPGFAAARNNLALIQARRGDFAAAEQRLRTGPPTSASLYNVGVLRWREQRYAEAALAFDAAAAAQPSMTIARQRSVQARNAARAAEQPR